MESSDLSSIRLSRAPLHHLYVLVFMSLIDHSTIAPIISSYARSIGATAEVAGLIAGAYSIAALFSYPVIGFLLDRLPRARVLLLFYTADMVMVSLYILSRDPAQLLVVRLLHGFFDASIFPSTLALFRDAIRERFGLRFSGYWAVAATPVFLGSTVTRALVLWLGFHSVFLFVVFLMLAGLYSSYGLNRVYGGFRAAALERDLGAGCARISPATLLASYLSAFTLYMMIGSVVGSMSARLESLYGLSRETAAGEVALWSAVSTATFIPLTIGVARYFLEDLDRSLRGLLLGLIAAAFSALLLVLSLETWVRYLSSLIFGLSLAMVLPITSRIAVETPYRLRGRSSAALGASRLLGVGVGTSLSSLILQRSDVYNMSFLSPMLASLAMVPFVIFTVKRRDCA